MDLKRLQELAGIEKLEEGLDTVVNQLVREYVANIREISDDAWEDNKGIRDDFKTKSNFFRQYILEREHQVTFMDDMADKFKVAVKVYAKDIKG